MYGSSARQFRGDEASRCNNLIAQFDAANPLTVRNPGGDSDGIPAVRPVPGSWLLLSRGASEWYFPKSCERMAAIFERAGGRPVDTADGQGLPGRTVQVAGNRRSCGGMV